jgi:hypothetical protein
VTRGSRLGRLALLLSVLAVLGGLAASCSSGTDVSATDDSFELHVRTPTTKPAGDAEAEAAFDQALAAAQTSTTTLFGGADTTTIYRPSSTTTTTTASSSSSSSSSSESSTTSTAAPPAVTPEVCKLYSQLINFYTAIKPQVDPNDPQGTASRIGSSVDQSAKGLDQILQTSPPDIKPSAATVIQWLRDAAAGNPVGADDAEAAFGQVQTWFGDHCK